MADGIKHKRVVALRDTGQPEDWNDTHEITGNVDQEQNQFLNSVIENRTDWPAGAIAGQQVYRTDYNNGFIFDGTTWRSVTPGFLIVVAADGTGDYLTIQEGIDALPGTGGIVHVKTGTYIITAPIVIGVDDTTLEGDFYGTAIETITQDISMIVNNGHDRTTLRNLLIYGDGKVKNNAGIEWVGSHEGRIENVYIQNCGGLGIYMEGSDGNLISNPVVRDCWNYGILFLECDGNIIENPIIYDIVEDDWGEGIELNDSHRNIINSCIVEGCEGEGIYFWASTYNNLGLGRIRNNSFTNANVHAGIILDGTSTHNTILGNKSFDDQGVKTQRYGIREAGGVDNYNTITNNTCTGNITAEVSVQGANTINANNMVLP